MPGTILYSGEWLKSVGCRKLLSGPLRPGFQMGTELKKHTHACRLGCDLWTERRIKLLSLSFPPSNPSSKPLWLPCKPILSSDAFKASLIWSPAFFPSPSHPWYAPARMGAATECLDSENARCTRSHTRNYRHPFNNL